jgi:hypothetical protein
MVTAISNGTVTVGVGPLDGGDAIGVAGPQAAVVPRMRAAKISRRILRI